MIRRLEIVVFSVIKYFKPLRQIQLQGQKNLSLGLHPARLTEFNP